MPQPSDGPRPDRTAVRHVLDKLRGLPRGDDASSWWRAFEPADRPALFHLLAVAADLPRFAGSSALAELIDLGAAGATLPWPELASLGEEVLRLQRMVDLPVVTKDCQTPTVYSRLEVDESHRELNANRCVTVDFLFDEEGRRAVDARVAELATERAGTWGELQREEASGLFPLVDQALAGDGFRHLTGFDLERDEYTLTLSLQDLDRAGIGWHRDLYWPREWVGEDVFAVLYGLGDDSREKGGAFLYYVPESDSLFACYRRRHQATVLWNAADSEKRLLHAVSGYHGDDTSRHLLILQCLRRAR